LLARAERAEYPQSSLRDLPDELRTRAFDRGRLRPEYREPVEFVQHDVRDGAPDGPFSLVLCRNLVFTYFADGLQRDVGRRLARSLHPGGALVVGIHEALPDGLDELEPWSTPHRVFRVQSSGSPSK
jgi:chemotaxis protein methyltransferase CheR